MHAHTNKQTNKQRHTPHTHQQRAAPAPAQAQAQAAHTTHKHTRGQTDRHHQLPLDIPALRDVASSAADRRIAGNDRHTRLGKAPTDPPRTHACTRTLTTHSSNQAIKQSSINQSINQLSINHQSIINQSSINQSSIHQSINQSLIHQSSTNQS